MATLLAAGSAQAASNDVTHELTQADAVRLGVNADPPDPDLEPGFPVRSSETSGTYHGGPAIHALVGNIDGDPTMEIMVTALAAGPLYAWNSDGSPQPGWPAAGMSGAAYSALGQLSSAFPGFEVFSGHFPGDDLVAYNGAGVTLPGWPRNSANYVATPPALADVDGDGLDEIFIEEEDGALHAYRANGSVLPGWPVSGVWGAGAAHARYRRPRRQRGPRNRHGVRLDQSTGRLPLRVPPRWHAGRRLSRAGNTVPSTRSRS